MGPDRDGGMPPLAGPTPRDAGVRTADLEVMMHPDLQWTTFRGEVLGCEDYIAGNTGGHLRWRAQRLDDVKVVVVGDTAVLTALVTDEVTRAGQDLSFRLRLTQTWVRAPEGWRCLSGHASAPVR
jgi:Domain of unknown function (DUF4440)